MYEIRFSHQAKKFIKNLDTKRKTQLRIIISDMKQNPFSYPYKKLEGMEADFRVRKGEFRIAYSIHKKELLIEIIKIGRRENFYK